MDLSFRKCSADRFSSLPNELICKILSLLPTKDAVVARLSSQKLRIPFTSLTTLDFDDSPISHCASKHPQFIDRFQFFKSFVDNVLQTSQSPHLIRFRLRFGGDYTIRTDHIGFPSLICGVTCFPDLESTQLNAWFGFPLSRGVREIDMCFHVRNPGKVPSELFACETLEVLKLDTNLSLDFELVFSMPSFRLPNLKVLDLRSILLLEDDFVSRLISNFPLLEELHMECLWKYGNSVTISSPSLQKLALHMNKGDEYGNFFSIDTPNLRYLVYNDLLALDYSITSMNAVVEASFDIWDNLPNYEESFHNMLSLIRAVPNVQHLRLTLSCVEALDCDNKLKDQLPVFHHLTHLELHRCGYHKWNIVLFEFLKYSPVLETLEFPTSQVSEPDDTNAEADFDSEIMGLADLESSLEIIETERQFFRTNKVNLSCCKSCLKRVVIKAYWGVEREIEVVRFLLKNASVLKELLVICSDEVDRNDHPSLENTLNNLPRASSTCVIVVQREGREKEVVEKEVVEDDGEW